MSRLNTGDDAPAFSLNDAAGNLVQLSDYIGRSVVVYFYPADDTPGCTTEACQFTDAYGDFTAAGVEVLGVSANDGASHERFAKKYGLKVRLLSDPDHAVMAAYGAWGEKTLYGKKSVGVIRSTLLIGPDGKIRRAWYHVKTDGHASRVLAELSK